MKRIYLLAIIFFLTSCYFNNEKVNFEIVNNTIFSLDSLNIEPNTKELSKYLSLKPKQKIKYEINMSDIPSLDGAYVLKYRSNNKTIVKAFGYYSRGIPFGENFKIVIEKDTIKVKAKLN